MAANGEQRTVPDISFLLAHASHVLATRMAEALQEIGLTPRMFSVLMRALNGELTQPELGLARRPGQDHDRGHRGRAGRRGLRRAGTAAGPRRARLVRVTDRGWEATEAALEIVDRVHQEVLDALPPRQRDAFLAGLTTLADGDLSDPVNPAPQSATPATTPDPTPPTPGRAAQVFSCCYQPGGPLSIRDQPIAVALAQYR